MSFRVFVLSVLVASAVATGRPDGGPGRATPDAGTAKHKGPPEQPAPSPARPDLPPPRTQTSTPVGTGSETVPPSRSAPPNAPTPARSPTPTPH
jgi:hypothetical protein